MKRARFSPSAIANALDELKRNQLIMAGSESYLGNLSSRGIKVDLKPRDDSTLKIVGELSKLAAEDVAYLKSHKPELIDYLKRQAIAVRTRPIADNNLENKDEEDYDEQTFLELPYYPANTGGNRKPVTRRFSLHELKHNRNIVLFGDI